MKHLLLAALLFGLTGCGLRPVYGSSVDAANAQITVNQISGRSGHHLRTDLARRLGSGLPNLSERAQLSVVVEEKFIRLPLQVDGGASRTSLETTANYILRGDQGNVITQGEVIASAEFHSPDSPYGDIALQTDAGERAALALSRRIHEKLILDSDRFAPAE